jgi:hypothetical protein
MTITKARASIFAFPASWVSRLADSNLCELRGEKPTGAHQRQGKEAGILGEGYIEHGPIVLAFDPVDPRRRVETLVPKGPPPHDP